MQMHGTSLSGRAPSQCHAVRLPGSSRRTLAISCSASIHRVTPGEPLPVGAPHGEGFHLMLPTGHVTRLDVDELNERLKFQGAARLRNIQAPDQAHGLIFQLDHLITDTRAAMATAWRDLASARELPCPSDTSLLLSKGSPERVITSVLGWTQDMREVRVLCGELSQHYAAALTLVAEPAPGLRPWLELAATYDMPCAAVSSLDRATVRRVLERLTLHDHFRCLITAEDEHETQAQALMAAAMRLQRPPDHCVLFDDDAQGITAAHNVTMKAVALLRPGRMPAYRLRQADVTVASLSELTVYNIRRLFANRGCELGDVQKKNSDDKPPNRRRVASAML